MNFESFEFNFQKNFMKDRKQQPHATQVVSVPQDDPKDAEAQKDKPQFIRSAHKRLSQKYNPNAAQSQGLGFRRNVKAMTSILQNPPEEKKE